MIWVGQTDLNSTWSWEGLTRRWGAETFHGKMLIGVERSRGTPRHHSFAVLVPPSQSIWQFARQ